MTYFEPLWPKVKKYWDASLASTNLEQKIKLFEEAQVIEDIIISRNINGIQYEKSGQIDKAIELYEANILDLFDGSHPYERLRIIYTREDKFSDAIRVCTAYIAYGQNDLIRKEKYKKTIDSLQKKISQRTNKISS